MVAPEKVELLMKSRQLVHTSYDITAVQNRMYYYCLFNAQKEKNGNYTCTVGIDFLKKFISNKNQRSDDDVAKALQVLEDATLIFETKNEDNESEKNRYKLVTGTVINEKKRTYKIKFVEELYEHLMNYTVYAPLDLNILARFKSFYSQRLYELIRLWSRTDEVVFKEFKVEQLRFILAVEDKYPNYKNLKQRVLNQAVKEINESGNMELEFEDIRKGRSVGIVKFKIIDHEKKRYFNNIEKSQVIDEYDENCVIDDDKTSGKHKVENKKNTDFYIPNKKLFTAKTLSDFIDDFNKYDFKDSGNKKALQGAILTTLEKDDEDKIKVKAYEYFKATLKDQLKKASSGNSNAVKSKSNKFDNFDQTIEDMSQDEFDSKVESSQKAKFSNEISDTVEMDDNDINKKLYEQAIEKDWNVGPHTKNMAIKYAKERGLSYPEE